MGDPVYHDAYPACEQTFATLRIYHADLDPATLGNVHLRAPALEGQLFRTALERALRSGGVHCSVIVERDLSARTNEILGRPGDELQRVVLEAGRRLGGPWRADEKTAFLAGWLTLASAA